MVAPFTLSDKCRFVLGNMLRSEVHWHHCGDEDTTEVVANHDEDAPRGTVITSSWAASQVGGVCGHRVDFTPSLRGEQGIQELVIFERYAASDNQKEIARFELDMDVLVNICEALIGLSWIVGVDEWIIARARIMGRFSTYLGWPPHHDMSRDDKLRAVLSYRSQIFDALADAFQKALAAFDA